MLPATIGTTAASTRLGGGGRCLPRRPLPARRWSRAGLRASLVSSLFGADRVPADLGPAVPAEPVRVPGVVDLEAERRLEVVSGLLVEPLHDRCAFADVDDVDVWRAGHAGGNATHC